MRAAKDFTPAMREIAAVMEAGTRERFDTGRAPDGTPWVPSQRVLEQGGRTLVDTAALLQSIASGHDATSAVVGTNLVYARIHQTGGEIRARNARALRTPRGPRKAVRMPARPFLGWSEAEKDNIVAILSDHLAKAFAPSGSAANSGRGTPGAA